MQDIFCYAAVSETQDGDRLALRYNCQIGGGAWARVDETLLSCIELQFSTIPSLVDGASTG
jgi:hypothetical protein